MIAAAQSADLHEFIMELPDGYETKIGEDGIKLSGGQKQRMAIAAFTRHPRILILDDATSALDSHTEANVQAALADLMRGRTNFVIAHRLSTIMNADRILVMDGGKIVDFGTHAELVNRPGVYHDLPRTVQNRRQPHPRRPHPPPRNCRRALGVRYHQPEVHYAGAGGKNAHRVSGFVR